MENEEIIELAKSIQIRVSEEEVEEYKLLFKRIDKELEKISKFKEKGKKMTRINIGDLSLSELDKISRGFKEEIIEKEIMKKNCLMTEDNFIIFRKKKETTTSS
jgi:hypothetical protein